ncbi:MAG: nucleotidyl transferase AbiEii/AbiGii toxin family protein [bacterium]
MSKLHFEFLNKNQKKTLDVLKNFSDYGILGGGTALTLQFSHRYSYDLDIFVPKLISKRFLYKVKRYFKKIEIITDTGDEFSFVSLPYKVKISFIYYPFFPLYQTISTPYLKIFSWKDIALDKAHTIGRRGEWRDYVDLYFAVQKGFLLKNIISGAQKKFTDSFSEKLFLSQLTYWRDLKDFTINFIKKKYSQKEIEKFFQNQIKTIKL